MLKVMVAVAAAVVPCLVVGAVLAFMHYDSNSAFDQELLINAISCIMFDTRKRAVTNKTCAVVSGYYTGNGFA